MKLKPNKYRGKDGISRQRGFWLALTFVGLCYCSVSQAQPSNSLDHFIWGGTPAVAMVSQDLLTSLQARDQADELITNFNGTASLSEVVPGPNPNLLITEVETINFKRVEISNVSTNAIDVSGWRVVLYDRTSWPSPKVKFTIPAGTICPSQGVFAVRAGSGPSAYPDFYATVNVTWNGTAQNNQIAVLLQDAAGTPVDFICAVDAYPPLIAVPLSIGSGSWSGPNLPALTNPNLSYQRVGRLDQNSASDWILASNSFNTFNPGLVLPFLPQNTSAAVTPSIVVFTNGLWDGALRATVVGNQVRLRADDGSGHAGESSALNILGLPTFALQMPKEAFKGTPGYLGQGSLFLADPLSTNLTVGLISSGTNQILVPPVITVIAGATNANFGITNLDNGLLEGPQSVKILATASGFDTAVATITNYDHPPVGLTVSLPASVSESAGWSAGGQVRSSAAVAVDVVVRLACTNGKVFVPDFAIIPAGQSAGTFGFAVADNSAIDGSSTATISASVPGWLSGQAQVIISDNENTNLAFSLLSTVNEGSGMLTNVGSIQLSGVMPTNVVVTLTSDLPARVQVPATVIILAGQTTALFNMIIPDDAFADGNQIAHVTASAASFSSPTRSVTVIDNEVTRFAFASLPAAQVAGQPFPVTITALNVSGNVVAGYSGSVDTEASGFLGSATVIPATLATFTNGVWSGMLTIPAANRGLNLGVHDAQGHNGISTTFEVVASRILNLPASDMVYDALRNKLLVGVISNATGNGQSIIGVDPDTGSLGTPIPLGADPSRIAVADDFSCLYAGLEVNSTGGVVRVDLNAQSADLRFAVGTVNMYGQVVNYIEDMKVQPGHSHTLVATTKIQYSYNQYIAVYDDGVQRSNVVSPVYYVRTYHLAFADSPFSFYITKPNGLWINIINAGGASFVQEIAGPQYGADVVYGDGRLYSTSGQVFSTNDFHTVGTYAASGLVIPDPANARVYFLTQEGAATTFRAFELSTFLPIAQIELPYVSGQASSFVKCGTNRFAFLTSGNQLHIFDTSLLYNNSAANLGVKVQTSPAQPVMGSNLVYSITVSNAGPAASFGTVLTNQIPAWSSFVSATSTLGTWSQANGIVTTFLGQMTNGAVAIVTIIVRPDAGGAHLNVARVAALTHDPDQTDNLIADVQSVLVTSTNSAVAPISLPSNDIVFDPATERIWASVPSAPYGLSNCLVALNPMTGEIGNPIAVGEQPNHLTIGKNGEHLYVGLDGDYAVRRFNTLTQSLFPSFSLGIGYVAFDLAVRPGFPQSVAVSRYSPLGQAFNQVALYDDGVARAGMVHSPRVEFSPDGTVLYGTGWNGYTWPNTSSDAFYINQVSAGGLTTTNSMALPFAVLLEMDVADGLVYYTGGGVLDPAIPAYVQRFAGIGYVPILCVDESANRVFFLFGDGQNLRLQQFNLSSYELEASLVLPPPLTDPHDLIRWGTNGLAFRNGSGQIFLVQIPLMPKVSKLAVSQSVYPTVGSVGSNLTYSIVVTNRGPGDATNVILTDTLPSGAKFVSASSPQGSVAQSGSTVTFAIGTLSKGTAITVQLMAEPAIAGWNINSSVVVADLFDSSSGQNSSALTHWVDLPAMQPLVSQVNLQAAMDIVYDPSNQTLLASIPATGGAYSNSIVGIDIRDGAVKFRIPMSDQPGRLALSDDNQYLYTALTTTGGVARISLASNINDLTFGLGVNEGPRVWAAGDLKVVPGQPRSVAVSVLFGQSNEGVMIYDDNILRTNKSPGREFGGVYFINFGATGSTLYSTLPFYFRTIAVNASGATLVAETTGLVPGYDAAFEFDGGRVYFQTGRVIDPVNKTIVGAFPAAGLVAPDSVNGRVYYVTSTGYAPFNWQLTLRAFDLVTSNEVWSVPLPIASGYATRLTKLGTNGLAVLTDTGHLFLVPHTNVTVPTAELSLEQTVSPSPVSVSAPLTCTFTVRNNGPWTASGVVLSNALPSGANFISASSSQGTCGFANGSVVCLIGAMVNGAAVTVTINLAPTTAAGITNVASVSGNEFDTNPTNNFSTAGALAISQPALSVRDATAIQNPAAKTAIAFTLTLSQRSSVPVSVGYQTADGTALAGQEYDAASGVVTFNAGTTNRQLNLNIIRNTASSQPTSFFRLNLLSVTNATSLRTQAVGTIVTRAFRTLTISGTNILEGNSAMTNAIFKISLNPTSAAPVSVQYETIDGTAVSGTDYQRRSGTLVLSPGTTSLTLAIPVFGNTFWQPDKTFSVLLSQPQNAVLAVSEALGTIVNDDALPALAITLSPTNHLVSEGDTVVFAVGAVGTPLPLSYQWQFNGTPITGAITNSLILTNVQPEAAGYYSVSVLNGAGASTNVAANLKVLARIGSAHLSNQLVLTWTGPYILQSATNVAGPYVDLLTAKSPYTNWIFAEPQRFFRLRAGLNGVISTTLGANGQLSISGSGFAGYTYVLQTSTNLVDWLPLQTNAAPFQHILTGPDAPMRFFRTLLIP